MTALHLDAAHLFVSYPDLLKAAQAAHTSTAGLILPLTTDATAYTLTTHSSVLEASSLAVAGSSTGGSSSDAPTPLFVSEQGNSGQAGLRYPLFVAPNADGFVPQVALQYSSQDTNQRTDLTAPASDVGEGWSLSVASISSSSLSTQNPSYFLTDLGNVSDTLIADSRAGFFQTEHVSHLRIQQLTSSQTGQPCFQVFDRSGTFYEFGCTPDALQHTVISTRPITILPYRWDLDRVVAPHQGPASQAAHIAYRYLQDCGGASSCANITVFDAAIKQISYGTQSASGQGQSIVGTHSHQRKEKMTKQGSI